MGITKEQLANAIKKTKTYIDAQPDVAADFLTAGWYGNLRYYNGKFQCYETSTSSWVDTEATANNVYIMNVSPQIMKSFSHQFDSTIMKYKLRFEEPDDTVIDGPVVGTFMYNLTDSFDVANMYVGASLSCKPLAKE